MAIYIKGMEMPEACNMCIFSMRDPENFFDFNGCCLFTEKKCKDDGINEDCPLVYIPEPHGRLIDADGLSKKLCKTTIFIKDGEVFQRMINDAPTVIEGSE